MKTAIASAALGVLLAACGSSDEKQQKFGAPPKFPVPECRSIDQSPCDIRDSDCEERLMTLAACLRGSDPIAVPPITMMTEEELAAYLNENIAANPTPSYIEDALVSVGLVQTGAFAPQTLVARDVEFLWGLYRNQEKDVIIVDHGVPSTDADPNSVLVHEFVHALQDVDVDLQSYIEERWSTYDSYLAARSISEGEARMHQMRFFAALIGLDPARIDWDSYFDERARLSEEYVLEDASPYLASFSNFPYELGARYVHHAWISDGKAGIDALFASPPARTQAVMASVSEISNADWPAPEFADLPAPAEWELVHEESLGAWGTLLYISKTFIPAVALSRALEWRGDDFEIYVSNATPPETAVVWRIEFSSQGAASAAHPSVVGGKSKAVVQGNRLLVTATTGTSTLDWAVEP